MQYTSFRTIDESDWQPTVEGFAILMYGPHIIKFCQDGDYDSIHKYLKEKLVNNQSLNKIFTQGLSPLSWAVIQGHTSIVKLLLDYGADPNILNENQTTALTLATSSKIIQMLIKGGANLYYNYGIADSASKKRIVDHLTWPQIRLLYLAHKDSQHQWFGRFGPYSMDIGILNIIIKQFKESLHSQLISGGVE